MREIVFITGNLGKVESAKKHFIDTNINLEWYKYDFVEPNINDIEAIVRDKVIGAYQIIGKPCIALDAGFYINNFPDRPGFPGAFPNREILDKGKMGIDGLLVKMQNVSDRSCYFLECLGYYDGDEVSFFYGISNGTLATTIRGSNDEKKWSDLWKVFIPNNYSHTLAEMTTEERNNRMDGHTSAFVEFASWYKSKDKCLIKKCL